MSFTTSQTGIELIKSFEKCKLTAYQDTGGVWTIGYGHTAGVYSGMTITQSQADSFLREDLKVAENKVNSAVTYSITQKQFDVLVSFTYNVGINAFANSTLLRKLNAGDVTGAADQFDLWIYDGGEVQAGLVNRRAKEKELFLSGIVTGDITIRSFQTWINQNYASNISTDGIYGSSTKKAAIKAFQTILGVTPDGVFGAGTKSAAYSLTPGMTSNAVHIMQGMLYCRGFNPKGVHGYYGAETTNAVKSFQTSKSLATNGIANKDTLYALFN